jgi:hypothetical protein
MPLTIGGLTPWFTPKSIERTKTGTLRVYWTLNKSHWGWKKETLIKMEPTAYFLCKIQDFLFYIHHFPCSSALGRRWYRNDRGLWHSKNAGAQSGRLEDLESQNMTIKGLDYTRPTWACTFSLIARTTNVVFLVTSVNAFGVVAS